MSMKYIEVPATGELAEAASHAWYLESPPLRRFEKILPLPRAHVILNLSEPYWILDRSGNREKVPDEFISGLHSEYLIIEPPKIIRHVGVELLPGGLHALSPTFAASSAERVQDARLAFDGIDTVAMNLRRNDDPSVLIESVLTFFSAFVNGAPSGIVKLIVDAIDSDPRVRIGELSLRAAVSQRHLISSFKEATGMTPKRYSQVLRFHRLVDALGSTEQLVDWARLATDHGYYDQPHVIHAFRRFSGWTPAEYVRLVSEYGAEAAHFVPMQQAPEQARR